MSEHEALLRALLHDLRSPLNVVQAALSEIEVPEDDRYVDLAGRSTQQCVFALSFVQRGLDALGQAPGASSQRLAATQLRAEVDALLDGAPAAQSPVRVEPARVALAPGTPAWGVVIASLGLLSKKAPLTCTLDSAASIRVERPAPWDELLAGAADGFASQRPGYAAWILAAALRTGGLGLSACDAATALRVNASAA